MSSLAALLLLADGRLPAGGHAHSGGLESAVAAGRLRDLDDLAEFLHGRLRTAGRVAAAFAAAACAATQASPTGAAPQADPISPAGAATQASLADPAGAATPADPISAAGAAVPERVASPDALARLGALDDGLDARTPSPALRRSSRSQGRALLRAGRSIFTAARAAPSAHRPVGRPALDLGGTVAALPGAARQPGPHHPVALGLVAAAAAVSPVQAAVAAAHGVVTTPATAAVRLLGLDPYAVHALLAGLAGTVDLISADAASRVDDPVDALPADSAPLLDVGAEHHASREVRLFAS